MTSTFAFNVRSGSGPLTAAASSELGRTPDHELLAHPILDTRMSLEGSGIDLQIRVGQLHPNRVPAVLQLAVAEVHGRAADESGDEQVVGVVEEVGRPAHLLQVPGTSRGHRAKDCDSIAEGHRLDLVVGDIHRGRLETAVKTLQLGPHLDSQLGIEVGERLVHQEGCRLAHDGPTHGNTLSLTTGERLWLALQVFADLEDVCGLFDPTLDLVLGELPEFETEGHVVVNRHVRVEGVVLEHHGDVAVLRCDIVDDLVADHHRALGDVLETGDHPENCRFAASGRAHENEELAIFDLEVEVAYRPGSVLIDLPKTLHGDSSHV